MKKLFKKLFLLMLVCTFFINLSACSEKKVKSYIVKFDLASAQDTIYTSMEKKMSKNGGEETSKLLNEIYGGANIINKLFYNKDGYSVVVKLGFDEDKQRLNKMEYEIYFKVDGIKMISKNMINMIAKRNSLYKKQQNQINAIIDRYSADDLINNSDFEKGLVNGFVNASKIKDINNVESKASAINDEVIKIKLNLNETAIKDLLKANNIDLDTLDEKPEKFKKTLEDKIKGFNKEIKTSKVKTVYY